MDTIIGSCVLALLLVTCMVSETAATYSDRSSSRNQLSNNYASTFNFLYDLNLKFLVAVSKLPKVDKTLYYNHPNNTVNFNIHEAIKPPIYRNLPWNKASKPYSMIFKHLNCYENLFNNISLGLRYNNKYTSCVKLNAVTDNRQYVWVMNKMNDIRIHLRKITSTIWKWVEDNIKDKHTQRKFRRKRRTCGSARTRHNSTNTEEAATKAMQCQNLASLFYIIFGQYERSLNNLHGQIVRRKKKIAKKL